MDNAHAHTTLRTAFIAGATLCTALAAVITVCLCVSVASVERQSARTAAELARATDALAIERAAWIRDGRPDLAELCR